MTEEEYFIKNYPDSCYGDRPLSPYWDFFQDGVEFGERQSENKIEELEETINKLREQFALRYDLEDKLRKENETLEGCLLAEQEHTQMLEKQIEKMKCCGNCRFSESDTLNGTFCHREGCFVVASAKCKLWEM